MNSAHNRRVARAAVVAVTAASACLGGALLASPALADDEHALESELHDPAPVVPGTTGTITYEVTNVSDEPTDGVLLNMSLPPHVTLDADPHCQQTGENPEGGILISCSFNDAMGKLQPGESQTHRTPFHVDADAPESSTLGDLGALVVPLEDGEPTEDWKDLDGPNTSWAEISTARGGQGAWEQLRGFLGF